MKTTFQKIATNFAVQMQINDQFHFSYLAGIAMLLFLSSCSDDNTPHKDPKEINTIACKNRPGQISFGGLLGGDTSDIEYNLQGKPVKITTNQYNIAALSQPPVVTVYTIEYNAEGNAVKVNKSVDNEMESYYQLEYNSAGKLIKQSKFNEFGVLAAITVAQYDDSSALTAITTHNEDTSVNVTTTYHYINGNLVQKSIENLYDLDSREYYNADYSYTYFPDKENKVRTHFEGPLGLLFISSMSNQQSLQYLPNRINYQLLFARETSAEKKMLKNIEIIAYRYATQDTTKIDYSYEYDTDGFPTIQKGTYKNVTRRNVPSPFGGSVLLITPNDDADDRTINFLCN